MTSVPQTPTTPAPAAPAPAAPAPTRDQLAAAPKVVLHDHLDGGYRPETIIELAAQVGYTGLPSDDPETLRRWFRDSADSGSLVDYIATFDHTIAVSRTSGALARVAREAVLDLAADGAIYAELRFAPENHEADGLTIGQVVDAVLEGLKEGEQEAAAAGNPIVARCLTTAMRHNNRGLEVAELTLERRERGVAGFDIAGAEIGFPPENHLEAFDLLRHNCFPYTIHAGEAVGPESMKSALTRCGADRIGHGVRIIEDVSLDSEGRVVLSPLAHRVRDARIPLELCPSSNIQTGAAESLATHPFGRLRELGFNVTVNTDNRLMSGTTMTNEFALLSEHFGYGLSDFEEFTRNALAAAFIHHDERERLLAELLIPGYRAAGLDAAGLVTAR